MPSMCRNSILRIAYEACDLLEHASAYLNMQFSMLMDWQEAEPNICARAILTRCRHAVLVELEASFEEN